MIALNDMSIPHNLKLHFLSNFSSVCLWFAVAQTAWFAELETENVFPEVLRREGLHKRKYSIVDAGKKQQKDTLCKGSHTFLVSQQDIWNDTKEEHLH